MLVAQGIFTRQWLCRYRQWHGRAPKKALIFGGLTTFMAELFIAFSGSFGFAPIVGAGGILGVIATHAFMPSLTYFFMPGLSCQTC
jgi:hypothetical protein